MFILEVIHINKSITSRESILTAAKEIAFRQGLAQINIRAVAAQCGVAVGSIYNYFLTKSDLIAAVVEDFWRQAAHRETCVPRPGEPFPDYVGRLYGELSTHLSEFQSGLLAQMDALGTETREKSRVLEARCFDHIRDRLTTALLQAPGPTRFRGREAQVADFTFRHMLSLLKEGAPDCAFLQEILAAL